MHSDNIWSEYKNNIQILYLGKQTTIKLYLEWFDSHSSFVLLFHHFN